MTTKIHLLAGDDRTAVGFCVTGGQEADISSAATLVENVSWLSKLLAVVADKGYDADWFCELLWDYGVEAVIPPRSNRTEPRPYDREAYKRRNVVERLIAKMKEFRRISTRYEKLAKRYSRMIQIVLVFISLKGS